MKGTIELEERLERIENLLHISCKEVLDANEAALFIGISANRLYHLTAERAIPHYKRNGVLSFRKSELEEWLLGDKVDTIAELDAKAVAHTLTKSNSRSC